MTNLNTSDYRPQVDLPISQLFMENTMYNVKQEFHCVSIYKKWTYLQGTLIPFLKPLIVNKGSYKQIS